MLQIADPHDAVGDLDTDGHPEGPLEPDPSRWATGVADIPAAADLHDVPAAISSSTTLVTVDRDSPTSPSPLRLIGPRSRSARTTRARFDRRWVDDESGDVMATHSTLRCGTEY